MKRIIALLALTALLVFLLSGCGQQKVTGEAAKLSFSAATQLSELEKLGGKTVEIIGYMATLSPVSGDYIYLMNMPYQSCPFCVPNTQQLSNTMAVYAPEGKTFAFTDQAIRVRGTLDFGDYQDDFGYTYNYRITDASIEEVDLSTVSADYALWQTIAADGIVAEINSMFDYLHFVCCWTEYQMTGYTEAGGEAYTYFLYPGDAENILIDEGPNGYAAQANDSYFPGLIKRVNAISETELADLAGIVEDAKVVEQYARSELANGHYTYDEANDVYILNNAEDLYNQWYAVYVRFSEWLAKWEL